ncbi:AEC family transporter [Citricoccus sp. I39-566]|uniref:AEC family transporter n=1 Tax=Citricoccus sp. I39-566 TaxID=3073268 RepID=UPI00286B1739|nr:AEC family transporter [Citricoccus sp. I39-566]WMY78381.1 AEC family transporter [Citricoccus sp. I39-566]
MLEVISGFTVVWVIILVGYATGRSGVLGEHGQPVLSRVAFFVASPALLFDTLSAADVQSVLGPQLLVAGISALAAAGLYLLVARFVLPRRDGSETVIGALSASMVNSANLGIPIAAYVLGNAALAAPVLIFQLAVYTPIYVAALDSTTAAEARRRHTGAAGNTAAHDAGRSAGPRRSPSRWTSFWRQVGHIALNPMIIGSVLGLAFSATGWSLPGPIAESVSLIAGASIPAMLLAFGMSLVGSRPLDKGARRRGDVALASGIKLVIHPLLAWLVAGPLFGLKGNELLIAVVLGSLPTAQNVFVSASRYETGLVVSKDTILITTIVAIPAMIAVAFIFA